METPIVQVKRSPSLAVYRRIAVTFSVLTVLVVALVAYVVLLRAEVVVLSKQEEVRAEFLVDVAAESVNEPSKDDIPGTITSLEDSVTRTFPSTSVVKVKLPPKGQVRIVSAMTRPQTLIATTRLQMTDGTLYRLKKTVVVPAQGSVIADIYPDDATAQPPQGEISFIIPGLNPDSQRLFTVTSSGSLAGEEKDVRMVTASDMNAAEEVLKNEMATMLIARAREKATSDGASMDGEIVEVAVAHRTSDVPVGSDAEAFALTVTVRATVVHYDAKKLAARTRETLKDKLTYDKTLRDFDASGIVVEVEKLDGTTGRATLKVSAAGSSMLSADSPSFTKDKLLGVTVEAATAYLQGVDGVASASVRTKPWWSSRLPNVPDHIMVEVR